jgi:hypothetical protein
MEYFIERVDVTVTNLKRLYEVEKATLFSWSKDTVVELVVELAGMSSERVPGKAVNAEAQDVILCTLYLFL